MTDQFGCPICDSSFGSAGSVKAHITRKTDEAHKGESGPDYEGEIGTVAVSDNSDGSHTNPSDGIVPESDRHSADTESGDECCSNPSLQGSAGDVFELASGDYVRLEAGDSICVNCDSIHE